MPANEQTWRNPRAMHIVFGLSALAMLVTTIWMLAKDHAREWKPVQREFRRIEAWYADSKITEEDSAAYAAKTETLQGDLDKALAEVPDPDKVNSFVDEAQRTIPDEGVPDRVDADVRTVADDSPTWESALGYDLDQISEAYKSLADAKAEGAEQEELIALRNKLTTAMQNVLTLAEFDENNRFSALKFRKADLDVAKSDYFLGIGEGKDDAGLADVKANVDDIESQVRQLNFGYEEAKTHRLALEGILKDINSNVDAKKKDLNDHKGELDQLEKAAAERRLTSSKEVLDLPILDAFNSPLKINQIWLPKLTLFNNFKDVARFDRCATCHLGIDKSAAGAPGEAGYPLQPEEPIIVKLATPAERPEPEADEEGYEIPLTTEDVYGMQLTEGLFDKNDVTINVVRRESPAAVAQLEVGDVIEEINGVAILDHERAERYLLGDGVQWGQPLTLSVRRGLPNPYGSHPRLDLFVGSTSPHKMMEMGCTICHEGQGSATDFKWASHSPNTPKEADQWKTEHGWFDNPHWILPMNPSRFVESSCVRCHHEMTDLAPSEKFPEPPAPKVLSGFETVRQFGCMGCHEILGYNGPAKRVGPDLRLEPNYSAAAAQLLIDGGLTDAQRELAQEVIHRPDRATPRKLLAESILKDLKLAVPTSGETSAEVDTPPAAPKLSPESHKLGELLAGDPEAPGRYRRVGPSLRHIKSKVDADFLYSWVAEPKNFRPSTRMPQFFGLWDHLAPVKRDAQGNVVMKPALDGAGQPVIGPDGKPLMVPDYEVTPALAESQRFEPIEVHAVTAYLLNASQPFENMAADPSVNETASAERGKQLFQTRGCLACHSHSQFPEINNNQGPDLSRIGDKLKGEQGRQWLHTWLRNPNLYHPRTAMPILFLDPITQDGRVSDPAADIAEFLLSSSDGWHPAKPPAIDTKALDDLAAAYLGASFTRRQVQSYLSQGIPEHLSGSLKGDEKVLVAPEGASADEILEKKLLYVGRRTIGRLGCTACHDIPGFEDAKPIGTGLADWGRKDAHTLAFEQIGQYLAHSDGGNEPLTESNGHEGGGGHAEINVDEFSPDEGFFLEAVMANHRSGFIWQKLRQPRSYDYRVVATKPYIDRLRMPQFTFDVDKVRNETKREEVVTFVLGLVAEPPAAEYVYKPNRRQEAIRQGEWLVNKFNCDGCHTLDMETWKFEFDPEKFAAPPPFTDYAMLMPHFTPEQLEASKKVDNRGIGTATIVGWPQETVSEDDEGNPLYFFQLWKAAAINGSVWLSGGQDVPIPEQSIIYRRPQNGGSFARYLQPVALAMEMKNNPNAKSSDAWGWVPPPLLREGEKVQTQWLNDFLLEPYPIRPAVLLRMPKFNMSDQEARDFVNFFAARDNVEYPYEYDRRTQDSYLSSLEAQHPNRLNDAQRIVTNSEFCVKCHKIGDFTPAGTAAALAPNLDQVHSRMRSTFLEKWMADPKRLLPFTGMPQNFPQNQPVSQELFHGTSEEQLQAVVDFLLNYNTVMQRQPEVKVAPAASPAGN